LRIEISDKTMEDLSVFYRFPWNTVYFLVPLLIAVVAAISAHFR